MNNSTKWRNTALYALAYVLWLITLFMCLQAVIEIQIAANATWVAIQGNPYVLGLINQLSVILSGLAALIYTFALEESYRGAVRERLADSSRKFSTSKFRSKLANWGIDILLRRFAISFAIPFALFLLSAATVQIAVRTMATH